MKHTALTIDDFCKCRYPDGDEIEILIDGWMRNEIGEIANIAAESELDCDDELRNPDEWPRTYEVECEEGWVKVSVKMDWYPAFSAKVLEMEAGK